MEMLNSERKDYLNKIALLKQEKDAAYHAALRHVNRVVLTAEFLTVEQKSQLLDRVWEK